LREKYREIKRLRVVDGDHRARGQAHDPKREMAALARRFPGALRELDALSMEQIDARLSALDAALDADHDSQPEKGRVLQWAALQLAYHGTYRFALRLKRCAWPQELLDDAAVQDAIAHFRASAMLDAAHADLAEPDPEELDPAMLRAILQPASGRLQPWVLGYVAKKAGVSPHAVANALFAQQRSSGADDPE